MGVWASTLNLWWPAAGFSLSPDLLSSLASPTILLLILFCRSVFVVHGIMRPTRGFALGAFQLKVERQRVSTGSASRKIPSFENQVGIHERE